MWLFMILAFGVDADVLFVPVRQPLGRLVETLSCERRVGGRLRNQLQARVTDGDMSIVLGVDGQGV